MVRLLAPAASDAATTRKVKISKEIRELLCRQSGILSTAVAEEMKLDAQLSAYAREYRLANFSNALGAAILLASYVVDNETLEALRTAAATEARLDGVQQTKVEIIVGEELDRFKREHPDEFRKLRRNGKGHHAIASRLHKPIKERIESELHRKPLGIPMLADYIKKDRNF
jgi:hypothetical protein